MTRKPLNTDGFVIPRRQRTPTPAHIDTLKNSANPESLPPVQPTTVISRKRMASLPPIDLPDDDAKQAKKGRFRLKKPSRKTVKRITIALIILLLAGGGYLAYKFIINSNKIFKGNPLTAILSEGKELKKDANGRSNILLFGTSEDDPGHDGADLTDSIMVMSIDQKKKDAFMVSIPRDLYVDYGQACITGYKGKINVVYLCNKEKSEEAGQAGLRQKIGEVLGLDIQYSVHLNYTVLRQAVDAVGGITVTIESKDPRGILDRNFDWDCPGGGQTCYNVKYPNGPVNLDGKHALYLARARGADPLGRTYGLEQANFDREVYQRKILIALKDKAASAGTLANPVAISNLMDALGNNIRTNFEAEEIKTLAKFGQDVKNENIRSISLNDKEGPLVTTGNVNGESIVKPALGIGNFSDIQATILAYATGDFARLEKAVISVLNASGTPGLAQGKADEITNSGLSVKTVGNAAEKFGTAPLQLFDQSGGKKPETLKKLEKLLGVKAITTLPAGLGSNADFIIVVGPTPQTQSQSPAQ